MLQPGANGNDGSFRSDYRFGDAYGTGSCNQSNGVNYPYYKIPGFSNNKVLNKVHIQLIKKGEMIQLLADNKNVCYLGNVKIEKL